jgi:hypothetical protein
MSFPGSGLNCQWGVSQEIMRTVHAALGWRFFILLNCHGNCS